MPRVLVLGAGGMFGHVARLHLERAGHAVTAAGRGASPAWETLDAEDERALRACLERAKPDVVVNAVGVLVAASAADPARAIRVNALLPHVLSAAGTALGFRVVHVSTDCVFSGERGAYAEGDRRDADTPYGRTKALGELENPRDLTLRTSIIGPELKADGTGLLHWFLRARGTVRGYTRHRWSGVTTLELAKAVAAAIARPVTGLVHVTNGTPVSKHDLLVRIAAAWRRSDVTVVPDDATACDRSLVCTRADWPHRVPTYDGMLAELKAFMEEHAGLYPHYA